MNKMPTMALARCYLSPLREPDFHIVSDHAFDLVSTITVALLK